MDDKIAPMVEDLVRQANIFVPNALTVTANSALLKLKSRTQIKSTDIDEKEFVPYTKRYANRKKGGKRVPVTMTLTGRMIRDLHVEKRDNLTRVIKLRSKEQEIIGRAHHEGRGYLRNAKRRWFGLTKTQWQQVNRTFVRAVDKFSKVQKKAKKTIVLKF